MDMTPDTLSTGISRRALLRRAAAGALALPAARRCSTRSPAAPAAAADGSGQLVLNNYPGWIGKNELAAYAKKYPGDSVKMVTNATSSVAEVILQFKNGDFDVLLCDTTDAGQADAAGLIAEARLVEGPEHQERLGELPQGLPVGHPDRLRQGRHRLPAGHRRREDHELARRLAPGAEVLRPRRLHRPRARLPRLDAQVPRLLVEHERRQADRGRQGRDHQDQAAPAGVPQHERRPGSRQRLDRDRDGLGLRRRAAQAEAAEDRVGRAERGHARLPRGLQRAEVARQHRSVEKFLNFALDPLQYADFVNTTGTAYMVPAALPSSRRRSRRARSSSRAPPCSSASSSTTTSAPRARSSSPRRGKR